MATFPSELNPGVHGLCYQCALLYGRQTWTMYQHQERRLNSSHLRCLRFIKGLSWRDHMPNTSVLQATGSYDLITNNQSRISRTPYPPIGGPTLSQGPKIQSRHHLAPQRKLRPSKSKYEALQLTEVGGLWKKSAYTLQLLWVPLNVRYLCITAAAGGPLKAK